jgi:hypothetical protein
MSLTCEYIFVRGQYAGQKCPRQIIPGEKFCETCITKSACRHLVSEDYKFKHPELFKEPELSSEDKRALIISNALKNANVTSFEVLSVNNCDNMICFTYTLETDIGTFKGEDIEFMSCDEPEELIAVFRPNFGNILKTELIKQSHRCVFWPESLIV